MMRGLSEQERDRFAVVRLESKEESRMSISQGGGSKCRERRQGPTRRIDSARTGLTSMISSFPLACLRCSA